MQFNLKDITDVLSQAGFDVAQAGTVENMLKSLRAGDAEAFRKADNDPNDPLRKHTVPARSTGARLYENGPFSLIDGDVYSSLVTGGSSLMQWIPTRPMDSRMTEVQHLDYVSVGGFDGSTQTYAQFLNSLDIGECDYGPSTTWSGFRWQQTGGTFSFKTGTMQRYQDSGLKYYQSQPIYTMRGGTSMPLDNDADWAIARVLYVAEQHLDYILKFGDAANSQMEWDGLDQMIRTGYVQSRVVGGGVPHWANPVVGNAAGLSVAQLLQMIRTIVRRIRNRIKSRNWQLAMNDMVIMMPETTWDNIAEHVAAGGMYRMTNAYGFAGDISARDYMEMYRQVRQGGLGFGTLEIDGTPVSVMTDSSLGNNSTLAPSTDAITGDIYVMTRRVNGMTLLEQQYYNWDSSPAAGLNENRTTVLNGIARTGWVENNEKCFYYYLEMAGRNVVNMMPLQGRIFNSTVPTLDALEQESGAYWNRDFYAQRELGSLQGTGV